MYSLINKGESKMNYKKILIIFLVLATAMSFASCKKNKCDGHVDANDDHKCDKCSAEFDDGDEAPSSSDPKRDITFTVQLNSGETVNGVKFTVSRAGESLSLVSDSNGKATASLEIGAYSLDCDITTLPEGCTVITYGFKVTETTSAVTVLISVNTPDGSSENPFFVSDTEIDVTLAAGEELFYNYRGTTEKYLTITEDEVAVNYGGNTYLPENGVIEVLISPEKIAGSNIVFSIKNTGDATLDFTMQMIAPLGSVENPMELTENNGVASVSTEKTLYYKWTAYKDGVLVLTSPTENNEISITRVIENDVPLIGQTSGSGAAYLYVKNGESITIAVSVSRIIIDDPGQNSGGSAEKPDEVIEAEVEFALNIYSGNASEPVPVITDSFSISIEPGSLLYFTSEIGKTVYITDESPVSVEHDTLTYTNEQVDTIRVPLFNPIFAIKNTTDQINGIYVEIK